MTTRLKLREAARDYGWLLAIAVSVLSVIFVISLFRAAPEAAETVGVDTGDTVVVVPQQPGPDYNTAAFCEDRATEAVPQRVEGPVELRRGVETITWPGNGAGVAEMSFTTPDNRDERVTVPMDKTAQECFKKKGGVR
jgi:hypothetical protein